MPCDIGYRSYVSVPLPVPKPLQFRKKAQAPKIDVDLLRNIGEEDNEFVEWLRDLDIDRLLKKALANSVASVSGSSRVRFEIKDGNVVAKATYTNITEQRDVEGIAGAVMERFQMESLALIAQLLDYETRLVKKKNGWFLECEKHDPNSSVHKYISVSRKSGENAEIRFEHFASAKERDLESRKFSALAQKFGLPISFKSATKAGRPIPEGTEHRGFLKEEE